MAEQVACTIQNDVKAHIKQLEKEIEAYEAKGELTPEENEQLRELRRRLYRSKARNHCC